MLSKSEFLSLYSTVLIVKSFEFDVRNGNWFLQSVVRSCVLSGNGQVSVYGNQVSRVLNMMVWLHWTLQSGNTVLILILSYKWWVSDEFRWWVQVMSSGDGFSNVQAKRVQVMSEFKWGVQWWDQWWDQWWVQLMSSRWVQDEFKMSSSNEFK